MQKMQLVLSPLDKWFKSASRPLSQTAQAQFIVASQISNLGNTQAADRRLQLLNIIRNQSFKLIPNPAIAFHNLTPKCVF